MEIPDSGNRTKFATGAVRDMHRGKGRYDLLPWEAIHELALHCEEGALKYGERNGVIKQYGCINPAKQRRVVCRHFDYHGGKRARRCYPEEIKKEDASCKDRQLEKGARTR